MHISSYVHPSSIIDEGAEIGENVKIWHFCHVSSGSVIGPRCVLGQNVFVAPGVRLGAGVKVQNNVSIYHGVTCEDDVFLGPSCVFTNVINPRSFLERKSEFKATLVQKGASIGANATILCGITIGQYALIGAGSMVLKSVPDFAIMVGNPAVQKGWASRYGHRLNFQNSHAICPENGDIYILDENNLVYWKNM